ncbi:MAG: hypothetical protein AM324_013970 [Candidatus Thorarchaeota archaeon SMTZ1-83]|nr:MAG: hypothetical protein AM324_15095 [Candidatus Thorarchaeota archaeon SMTZ1-83]
MSLQPSRSNLSVPRGVSIDSVTKILERGHGYEWMRLNQEVIFGQNPDRGMPDLLIVGDTIVVESADSRVVERLSAMLSTLSRQGVP